MVANILPLPRIWGGSKGQNSTFSEHGHVAYQIKGNDECSNMQAHILSLHTLSTPGVGSKVKTFFILKVVMLHIKLKGMEHRAPCKHIFYSYTHPQPLDGVKKSTFFFLKVVMLHIKLKGMEHRAPCKHIFCPYTHPRPLGLDQKIRDINSMNLLFDFCFNCQVTHPILEFFFSLICR